MGESTDDLADSSSKLREEVKALTGVDLMADENTYKSTAQIIKEIGAVYEKMSDVSQAALLEKLAGKNRASTVAGLIENYKIIDEVIESASNAEGSAIEENKKYMESIEGHLDRLTNKVQEFWYTLIDTGTVNAVLDTVTNLIDLVTKLVDTFGTLPTVLGGAFAIFNIKKGGGRAKYICKICHFAYRIIVIGKLIIHRV